MDGFWLQADFQEPYAKLLTFVSKKKKKSLLNALSMKKYLSLAFSVFLFGTSVQAHPSLTTPYQYQYSYQPQPVVYVDAAVFNTPLVYNAQYGRSTTRRVVPIANYATQNRTNYNTYGVTYNSDSYYKTNGSRYTNVPMYTQNAARGTTYYAYGQKRHEPTRVEYSHTAPCGY